MSFWKRKRVLITGGTGFIGSHLCDLLSEQDAEIKVTTHNPNNSIVKQNLSQNLAKIRLLKADLRELKDCKKAVQDTDIVIHLAAIVKEASYNAEKPATLLKDNSLITLNMLEAIKDSDVERTQVVSSASVYPEDSKGHISEDTPIIGNPDRAKFAYSWSKIISELYTKAFADQYNMSIGIVRPFNVYGPRVKTHVIPIFIKQMLDNKEVKIFGDGTQERSFIYVKDLVEGMAKLCELYPKPDPVNLGTNERISIIDLAKKIALAIGKEAKITQDYSSSAGSMMRICDTTKMEKITGIKPKTNLEEGIKETANWIKKNWVG